MCTREIINTPIYAYLGNFFVKTTYLFVKSVTLVYTVYISLGLGYYKLGFYKLLLISVNISVLDDPNSN
jgi:hypothetical protein